ncbi:general amidase [Glonium stellatum]|uniref:General amidase n=1 Tax=Glonium stellatum TaxID=574774 RepID=A0A8E2FA93_9PEZI|nr:general amidase [Glonium stellatum]
MVLIKSHWKDAASRKFASVKAKIPVQWILDPSVIEKAKKQSNLTGPFIEGLLSPIDKEITTFDSIQLIAKIREKTLTAEQVTGAFCKRAAIAHQLNNCLHEIFFEEALDRARELDKHMEKTGCTSGPLHGLPISLKDQFHVKGVETTMGYVGWIGTYEGRKRTGKEMNTNSQMVDDLLSLGAILYCKTSLPQTLLVGETHNNIIGYTLNPVNQRLSCGGSSGGEAALQALRGSTLGVGTDIGGSVRIPAAFCGTFSIKPSVLRFSYKDVANSNPGQTMVPSAIGFMATALSSLKLIMESILSTEPWLRDPEVVPIPWRKEHELTVPHPKLCFAIIDTDNIVTPHPPVARGMKLVRKAIERAGHEVVSWEPPNHSIGTTIHGEILSSDGGANIHDQLKLSGEPIIPEKYDDIGNKRKPPMPILRYQDLALQRKAYRAAYATYWESTKHKTNTGRPVDAVIMPVAPHAAVLNMKYYYYGYTEIVNLLDYSSVCIPVTHADKTIDIFREDYRPLNPTDYKNWEAYDADQYDGAPVGVQIMGHTLQEERTLSIAQITYEALLNHASSKL